MKHFFAFFGDSGDPQLEREFRTVYQEPGVRYLGIAFFFSFVGFTSFLLLDVFNHRFTTAPDVQLLRVGIASVFLVGLIWVYFARDFIGRHYAEVVVPFYLFGTLASALLPLAIHGTRSTSDFYWSLNSSLTTSTIVAYGFARLQARTIAVVVGACSLVGVGTAFLVPVFDPYAFGRLIIHMVFVTVASYSLRAAVEKRERALFLLARDNLSKNIYAKELEGARKSAEEGNAVKLRFLANMSHEFFTPMNGVIQTLELAAETAKGEMAKLISQAIRSGNALVGTLNSILDYSRWSQSDVRPSIGSVDLPELARRVLDQYTQTAPGSRSTLSLRLDLSATETVVRTDQAMVEAILTRLVDNAMRFTARGKVEVTVALRRRGSAPYPAVDLELTVVDDGIGIPERHVAKVLLPFFQIDDESNRRVGGTGLGLAIVSRLTDVLDGTVVLDSKDGVGTTVRVSLPVEVRSEQDFGTVPSKPVSQRSVDTLPGEKPRVLLVEDNDLNADLARRLLEGLGYDATHAANGAIALELAEKHQVDAILMDCQMPVMDGYEATRRLREREAISGAARMPIIAVTANALAGDREKCTMAGMDDYLAKPYAARQLKAMLEKWIPVAAPGLPAA